MTALEKALKRLAEATIREESAMNEWEEAGTERARAEAVVKKELSKSIKK